MKCGLHRLTRRELISKSTIGALSGWAVLNIPRFTQAQTQSTTKSRLALTTGNSRPENIFKAMKMIENQIKQGLIGKKRVVIKPNLVSSSNQLSASHVDCMEAILEFLQRSD